MDLFLRLLFMIGLLVLEELNVSSLETNFLPCQYVVLLYEKTLLRRKGRQNEFDHRKSYLTDESRYRLFSFFDQYRAKIANASCQYCVRNKLTKYDNVFRMNYHWVCEYLASKVQRNEWNGRGTDRWQILNTEAQYEGLKKIEEYRYRGYLSLGSMENNRGLDETYNFTVLDTWTLTADEHYEQSDVMRQFIDILQNQKEEEFFWTKNRQLALVMRPGTAYFGCSLRCNERSTTTEIVKRPLHHLTCVFATPREVFDGNLSAGKITEKSCSRAKPEGTLRKTRDNLPICVDAEYEKTNKELDWPCQFHNFLLEKWSNAVMSRKNYKLGGAQVLDSNSTHPYNELLQKILVYRRADTNEEMRTEQFEVEYHFEPHPDHKTPTPEPKPNASDNRSRTNDPVHPSTGGDDSESICRSGIEEQKFYLIPRYLKNCFSSYALFVALSGVLLFVLGTLICFHSFMARGNPDFESEAAI